MKGLRLTAAEIEAIQSKTKPVKKSRKSALESSLLKQLERTGIEGFQAEYRFHSVRDWRFDFAHPDLKLAIECEGLTHDGKGRHQNVEGMTEDCRKYNEAAMWGWIVLRFSQPMVKSGEAVEVIQRMAGRISAQHYALQRIDGGILPP